MLLQSLKACFAVIISVLCITTSVFAQSALPTAPSSLTVTSTGLPVSLSWTGYDDAVYFSIKRAITSGGPYTTIDTINAGLLLGVTNTAPINKLNHVFCSYSYKKQVMLLKQQHFTLNVANPLPNFLTQYTDVKAAPGAIYYYVVTATNFQGESSASNEVSVSIPAPRYSVTDIGTFGGETQPFSMNAKS